MTTDESLAYLFSASMYLFGSLSGSFISQSFTAQQYALYKTLLYVFFVPSVIFLYMVHVPTPVSSSVELDSEG